jgi:DNA repair exonuclease SbcCD ATPase subunit
LQFVQRRGKMECDLLFVKDGNVSDDILLTGGGGPADVASFALRLAAWSIGKTRPVQILDEPFKFLSRDLQIKASAMLKMVSEKFHCQFIMISHIPEIIEHADKIIDIQEEK